MKKLLLMPAFVLFMTGASSIKVEHRAEIKPDLTIVPLDVKVDSVNVKARELDKLIRSL